MLAKIGVQFGASDETRLLRVKNWICDHQPSKLFKLLDGKNSEYFENAQEDEKVAVAKLCEYLASVSVIEEKEVQSFLYSIINDPALTKKENQAKQMRFFKVFYNLLFGQDSGPRLYLFLAAVDKNKYLHLLQF